MQEKDYQWFLSHYDDIFSKYGESYLAIKNETVICSYSSYAEGVNETMKKHPLGSFIVQFCNGRESGYTGYISSTNFGRVI